MTGCRCSNRQDLAISTAGVAHVISIKRDLPRLARERLGTMERSVLQLAAEGPTNEHIAKHLNLNLKLVKALVNHAFRHGLVKR